MLSTLKISAELSRVEDKWNVIPDNRPSDYICALMSQHVYQGNALKIGDLLPGFKDWKIVETIEGDSEYFGALYYNISANHYVLAHRGTNTLAAWIEDFKGIYLGKISPQKRSSYEFVKAAVKRALQGQPLNRPAGLSFTGHSLGAFLAELSVFYCHRSLNFPGVNAISFECPGSFETLTTMQSQKHGEAFDLTRLDIIGYLSYPNMINTCNHQIGTLYQLEPNLGDHGCIRGWFTYQAHSISGIVEVFKKKDRPANAKFLTDWPTGNQLDVFYSDAIFKDGHYDQKRVDEEGNSLFKLEYEAHHVINNAYSNFNIIPLRHFGVELQNFLMVFYHWREETKEEKSEKALQEILQEIQPNEIKNYLLNFSLSQMSQLTMSSSTPLVSLKSGDVTIFRQQLSTWLSQSEKRKGVIKLMRRNANNSTFQVITELVSPKAHVGVLRNASAIAALVKIPKDASSQDVSNAATLLQQLQQGGRYSSVGVAEGAWVGLMEQVKICGVSVEVGSEGQPSAQAGATPQLSLADEIKLGTEALAQLGAPFEKK
jgi:hypothetical protein